MTIKITFLGAAGTVTGSKYLLQGSKNILVDTGMFQGERELEERNWEKLPIDLSEIDAVLITHAHIDHIGVLPKLYRDGLRCPVYATFPTITLAKIMLTDSGRIQEEDYRAYQKRNNKKQAQPLNPKFAAKFARGPLYIEADAEGAIKLFKGVHFNEDTKIFPDISCHWVRAGHILGAGSMMLNMDGKLITFSGDIGRFNIPILKDPEPVKFNDMLFIESTYGDSLHNETPIKGALAKIISDTYKRGGVVVIPSFAVGRAQLLLYFIRELKEQKLIPDLPVIVDSPMAEDATSIYSQYPQDYDEEALKIVRDGKKPFYFSNLRFTRDRQDSKDLNFNKEPMVIISASGMLTGGRVMHHVMHRAGDPKNTILFVGYQPKDSVGEKIMHGEPQVEVFGEMLNIRCHIESISGLSAHADKDELLRWCKQGSGIPKNVAVIHGELPVATKFAKTLESEFKWKTFVPKHREVFELE